MPISLSDILSGQDALSPQMLRGSIGAQMLAEPNTGGAQGGLLGALAAGINGGMGAFLAKNATDATTAARLGAQPDTLAAYASPQGPLAYAQQHPGMNQLSLARILAPAEPGTGQALGQGAINLGYYRTANGLDPNTGLPIDGTTAFPMAQLSLARILAQGASPVTTVAPTNTGRAVRAQPNLGAAPNAWANGGRISPTGDVDSVLARLSAATTPQARQTIISGLTPDQLGALRMRLQQTNAAQP